MSSFKHLVTDKIGINKSEKKIINQKFTALILARENVGNGES